MTIVLVGPPGYSRKQGPIPDASLQVYESCTCVSATSASGATALTRCPADHICKWRLRVRASRPTYGGAHAI
eukprot:6410728-Pyramimonas_sp.AAC.2